MREMGKRKDCGNEYKGIVEGQNWNFKPKVTSMDFILMSFFPS